jgi:hypothetical protein
MHFLSRTGLLLLSTILASCTSRSGFYTLELPFVPLSLAVHNSVQVNEIFELNNTSVTCTLDSTGKRVDRNGQLLSENTERLVRRPRTYYANFIERGKWNLSTTASLIIVPDPGISLALGEARNPALVDRHLPYPVGPETRITQIDKEGRHFLRYGTVDQKGVESVTYAGLCNGYLLVYAYLTSEAENARRFSTMWEESRFGR